MSSGFARRRITSPYAVLQRIRRMWRTIMKLLRMPMTRMPMIRMAMIMMTMSNQLLLQQSKRQCHEMKPGFVCLHENSF
jgi:hypothetical protein